jgi:predicted  nucleic acid-binding Zn-ribbon protein
MSRTEELKMRVEARRKQLEADLAKAKAEAHGRTNDAIEAVQKQLKSLNQTLEAGWDAVSEATAKKLDDWLK